MMLMLSIHGTTKIVQKQPVLLTTLFTRFCLMFLKMNVAITYAFMGEICYLEEVTLSTYIGDRNSLHQKAKQWVVLSLYWIMA